MEKVIDIEIGLIKPYEKNTKRHPQSQIDNVKESIRQFGFTQPLVLDKDNVVIIGHGRLEAAKQLGLEKVPCIVLKDLTEEQTRKLRIIDNKTNESEWDIENLIFELKDIDFDDYDFDFDLPVDDEEEKEAIEDDFDESVVPDDPKSQQGDIYKLGNHYLMCGDSTKREDIETLLHIDRERERFDLVLTDPPYGISIVQNRSVGGDKPATFSGSIGSGKICKTNDYMEVKGDDTTDTARLNYDIIKELSKNQILFGGNYFTDFLPPKMCWLVWDKKNGTNNFADVELAWTSFDTHARLYEWLWNGMSRKGDRKSEGKKRVHPTQKPVGLLGEILKDYSKENDSILDCFGGSGSTLIACEQLNRQCFMIEYEPYYVDVIISRWEQFTGKKAEKIN